VNSPATSPRCPAFHYAAFGLTCAYALLVFGQLTAPGGAFPSDLPLHVEFQGAHVIASE
jgi:hypothetical protein